MSQAHVESILIAAFCSANAAVVVQARLKRTEFEIEQGTFAGFAEFRRKLLDQFEIGCDHNATAAIIRGSLAALTSSTVRLVIQRSVPLPITIIWAALCCQPSLANRVL